MAPQASGSSGRLPFSITMAMAWHVFAASIRWRMVNFTRFYRYDPFGPRKYEVRLFANLIAFTDIILYAWLTLEAEYGMGDGYHYYEGFLTLLSFIPLVISFIYFIAISISDWKRSKTTRTGTTVTNASIIIFMDFSLFTVFSFLGIMNIFTVYVGSPYLYSSVNGDYVATESWWTTTWAAVCFMIILAFLHLILFIWSCVDLHRLRRRKMYVPPKENVLHKKSLAAKKGNISQTGFVPHEPLMVQNDSSYPVTTTQIGVPPPAASRTDRSSKFNPADFMSIPVVEWNGGSGSVREE